jgi:hypothetical protein
MSRLPVITSAIVAALLSALALPLGSAGAQQDPLLDRSREVTAEFASRMQAALQQGMADVGPVGAIGVCKDIAPDIAEALSRESGATVSRTSLRVRNPQNAPDDWQEAALKRFEAADSPQEHFERTADGGARYLKAIPTGGLCLTCHGTVLAPEIETRLDEAYPEDKATGYYLGDIRGAFSVVWPGTD